VKTNLQTLGFKLASTIFVISLGACEPLQITTSTQASGGGNQGPQGEQGPQGNQGAQHGQNQMPSGCTDVALERVFAGTFRALEQARIRLSDLRFQREREIASEMLLQNIIFEREQALRNVPQGGGQGGAQGNSQQNSNQSAAQQGGSGQQQAAGPEIQEALRTFVELLQNLDQRIEELSRSPREGFVSLCERRMH
jgi:hypothetical protein